MRGDLYTPGCGQTGPRDRSDRSGLQQLCTRSQSKAEFLSSTRSLHCDATTSMKIRSAVLEGLRNPGRWPVLRKTAKTSRAGRFPPPRRGPRRRRRPLPSSVPRPTPVPPRLGVFNRRPPAWFCGANQETRLSSPLAPSIQECTPQLPPGPS